MDKNRFSFKFWPPCNIYPTANIGSDVNIGAFTEIGHNVIIGDNTRIGAHCFIPEGVSIGKDCFIGPRVTFINDRYPPGNRNDWEKTVVEEGACIGAAVTVMCGVIIGKGALIGSGSLVTKNVPAGQTWYGVPAKKGKW